ncbi:MAG: MCE family protein [Deltaproteobacteria bacterium]|nr:MCE family protein [Deltaproteobacteria bacterium]MCZ6625616.1 MlaD family protein [Deltaproteobacteria bacterium]
MGKKMNPTIVGAFVIGAVVLVLIGVITFGSGRLFSKTYEFVLYFESSVNGLNIGAPVKVRGVEIGAVTNILLSLDREKVKKVAAESGVRQAMQRWDPKIPVIIEIDAKKLTRRGATGLALSDPAAFDALIERGLRGQLQTESLVTGLLFIDLDFHPGSSVNLVQASGSRYKEIPTIPTTFEAVQAEVMKVIGNLKEIKIEELIDSATKAIQAVNRLVSSPEVKNVVRTLNKTLTDINQLVVNVKGQVDPLSEGLKEAATAARDALRGVQKLVQNVDNEITSLSASFQETFKAVSGAMIQVKDTLSTAEGIVAEDSPLNHELTSALKELSAAARSIRLLANYLERHPEALIHGKNSGRR